VLSTPSARRVRAHLSETASDPRFWTSSIQLAKTAVAAVLAWMVASDLVGLPQAFLAPWAALLVVNTTVYRTLSQGAQQVIGTVAGVVLSWAVGNLVGMSTPGVAVLVVVGLLMGQLRWFRDNATAVAATGVIVLTTGYAAHDRMLLDRLVDTAVGIAVGLVVNLVVWPPLRDYSAARAIDAVADEVAELLSDMARGLRDDCDSDTVTTWVDRTRELDEDLDRAWSLLRQARESGRMNPRRAARGLRSTDRFETVLRDNEQAIAETRSMARTLGHSIDALNRWDDEFRERWLGLLEEAGDAIGAPDPERVVGVRKGLADLAHDLSNSELSGSHWTEYGALIMNLRNVVTSMDRVAEQAPVLPPRYAGRDRLLPS
jgi:uncharacterized membrane protein YgaE (UPF0421/DUF939 family)